MTEQKTIRHVYAIPPRIPGAATFYFRVLDGGFFERFSDGKWLPVDGAAGRDYLSRAIEGGDAIPTSAKPV